MKRLALFVALSISTFVASGEAAQTRGFVYATDFGTGRIADAAFGIPPVVTPNVSPACADAVLRHDRGLLYVVERFGCDAIRVLDPSNAYALVKQFSVGNGANPNDIVLLSPTRAYVTRYETSDLWIVNPQTGAHLGTISLAAFADADGIPEMNRMALVAGKVFVSVQRVDREAFFSPTDSSALVVIDPATDTIVDCDADSAGVQGIVLPFQNPTTELVVDGAGKLLVGCTGFYGATDGGIVRIDPLGLRVEAVETTEAALGGDIADVVPATAARGFAVLSTPAFDTVCKPYDRTTGAVGATLHATAGFFLADAEANDRGELWLCDRTPANPGIRVFDVATLSPLAGPVSTGLPPQDIAFDGASPVDVPRVDPLVPSTLAYTAFPNPSRGDVVLRVRLAPGAAPTRLRATIVDAAGRFVRTLEVAVPAGDAALAWDGKDARGRDVRPGVYGVRLEAGALRAAGRLVRLPSARL